MASPLCTNEQSGAFVDIRLMIKGTSLNLKQKCPHSATLPNIVDPDEPRVSLYIKGDNESYHRKHFLTQKMPNLISEKNNFILNLTLVLLNKLRCHALFKFSANQIT